MHAASGTHGPSRRKMDLVSLSVVATRRFLLLQPLLRPVRPHQLFDLLAMVLFPRQPPALLAPPRHLGQTSCPMTATQSVCAPGSTLLIRLHHLVPRLIVSRNVILTRTTAHMARSPIPRDTQTGTTWTTDACPDLCRTLQNCLPTIVRMPGSSGFRFPRVCRFSSHGFLYLSVLVILCVHIRPTQRAFAVLRVPSVLTLLSVIQLFW